MVLCSQWDLLVDKYNVRTGNNVVNDRVIKEIIKSQVNISAR